MIRCAFALDPAHAPSDDESVRIASDANPTNVDDAASENDDATSPKIIACHAHFSGDIARVPRERASRVFSTANDVFEFEVPRDLKNDRRDDRGADGGSEGGDPPPEALRVTLVQRFRKGWLRHSRARIPLDALRTSSKTFDLKNEQLDGKTYGTVTASWVSQGSSVPRDHEGDVYREWFFVPSGLAREVVTQANEKSEWFNDPKDPKNPTERLCKWPDGWSGSELSDRVHIVSWNNQPDSIPGSFFAFSCRRDTSRHSKEDLEDVFCGIARPLVGGTTCKVERRPRLRGEWLATGLMAFGKTVHYEGDRTVDSSKIVERFSSTARLDGLGDCEDIAKETAMAHADLVATEKEWTRATTITETCVEMCALVEEAKKYVCAIALCTVRRRGRAKIEAHAFAMLLPKCAFSDHEGRDDDDRSAFVADGTYPCDPSSKNEPRAGVRPWKYEHVVSALVYGEGEIYFRYDGEPKNYGVLADDLFPYVSDGVVIEWAYRVRGQKDRDAIERVLASNLPTTTRTFQYENETLSQRFRKLVRWSEIDTTKIFKHATEEEKRRIRIASAGFRTSCPSRETFENRLGFTAEHREHAGNVDESSNDDVHHIVGGNGSVPAVVGVANSYHTHHIPHGRSRYLKFNAPTPDDVAIFVAGRAAGLLVLPRGTEEERRKIQATSTVITRNNRYEMSSTDDANDAVTALWLMGMTNDRLKRLVASDATVVEKFERVRDALLPHAMRMAKRAVVVEVEKPDDGKWVRYEGGDPTLVKDITENEREHDLYLEAYEKTMGVRVSYLKTEDYMTRCYEHT